MEIVWEACAPECVSCPPGTNTPCNDFTLVSYIYSSGNFYNAGDNQPNGDMFVTAKTPTTVSGMQVKVLHLLVRWSMELQDLVYITISPL